MLLSRVHINDFKYPRKNLGNLNEEYCDRYALRQTYILSYLQIEICCGAPLCRNHIWLLDQVLPVPSTA